MASPGISGLTAVSRRRIDVNLFAHLYRAAQLRAADIVPVADVGVPYRAERQCRDAQRRSARSLMPCGRRVRVVALRQHRCARRHGAPVATNTTRVFQIQPSSADHRSARVRPRLSREAQRHGDRIPSRRRAERGVCAGGVLFYRGLITDTVGIPRIDRQHRRWLHTGILPVCTTRSRGSRLRLSTAVMPWSRGARRRPTPTTQRRRRIEAAAAA